MLEKIKNETLRSALAAGVLVGGMALTACGTEAESPKPETTANSPAAVYDHASSRSHDIFNDAKNNAAFTIAVGPNQYEAYVDAVTIERTVNSGLSSPNAEGVYQITAIGDTKTPVTKDSIGNADIFVLRAAERSSGQEHALYEAMFVKDGQGGYSIDVNYAKPGQDGAEQQTASMSAVNLPGATLLDNPQKLESVAHQADLVFQAMQDGTPVTFVQPLG